MRLSSCLRKRSPPKKHLLRKSPPKKLPKLPRFHPILPAFVRETFRQLAHQYRTAAPARGIFPAQMIDGDISRRPAKIEPPVLRLSRRDRVPYMKPKIICRFLHRAFLLQQVP